MFITRIARQALSPGLMAIALLSASSLAPAAAQAPQAACDRACLTTHVDAYYAAL